MSTCQQYIDLIMKVAPMNLAHRLLSEHGRAFAPAPYDGKRGTLGHCYSNCFKRMGRPLHYVEGLAVGNGVPLPLNHAWLTEDGKHAIDPTWDVGVEYFGVEFKSDFVIEFAERIGGYAGILDSLYMLKMEPEEAYTYLVSGMKK